jgi:hypothetical protein
MATKQPSDASSQTGLDHDALLCYCDEAIDYDTFKRAVWANPDFDFDQILDVTRVGTGRLAYGLRTCTACMLNAEMTFTKAVAEMEAKPALKANASFAGASSPPPIIEPKRAFKSKVYGLVDQFAPKLGVKRIDVAPILAAPGLKTILCISNVYPEVIGPRNSPLRVKFWCLSPEGKVYRHDTVDIATGDRLDTDISDGLVAAAGAESGAEELVLGSCWVEMVPKSEGSWGGTRPHYKLVTDSGTTAIHTQTRNGNNTSIISRRPDDTEHQIMAHINVADQPATGTLAVTRLNDAAPAYRESRTIPAYGAALFKVPLNDENGDRFCDYLRVEAGSDKYSRRVFIVADQGLKRVSTDHV